MSGYRPNPHDKKPVSLNTIQCRRQGRVVEAFRLEGERFQVWRDKQGRLYQGPDDAPFHAKVFQPVVAGDFAE